ncbi:hypothetical protein [Halosimplex amylolyticum]|uniref:hypothetical protein n=1 Tax=Halosimplex amylolyticum TaxID=3396616 RepID=UPI003F55C92B
MNLNRERQVDLSFSQQRIRNISQALVRAAVGDRLGLVIFLGTLVVFGLTWRIGFFITDNYTPANTLVALADGHLIVDEALYGTLEAPGMQIHDGETYGRNYGQVAFAVPFFWALRLTLSVADPGLILPALWSLLLLALAVQIGRLTDHRPLMVVIGAGAALSTFFLNARLAEPLSPDLVPLAALQLSALVATAFAASTGYRVLARMHDRRAGVGAAVSIVLATPVGFWATIPKRHVYVVALLIGVVYAFYRSREESADDALLSQTGFRGLAYALVGLLTWIHAGEGFVVFLVLVLVDVPTAPSNDLRTLTFVAAAFTVSMLPFFLTNVLISGDPVRPPRMLDQFGEFSGDSTFSSGSGSGGASGGGGGGGSGLLPPVLSGPVNEITQRLELIFGPFVQGLHATVNRPGDVYQTFVRAGYISSVGSHDNQQAINLTIVESAPFVTGVVGIVGIAANRLVVGRFSGLERVRPVRIADLARTLRRSPARATDALVAVSALLFFLVYIHRLPLHAQVTVRYLLPLYPLAVYGVVRQSQIRRALGTHGLTALWTYLVGVLIGAQLLFVAVTATAIGRGGALQLHAVVGLVVAASFALVATASAFDERFDRATAVVGALAAALGTNLVVLSALVYFQYGPYALPMVDWLADLLSTA